MSNILNYEIRLKDVLGSRWDKMTQRVQGGLKKVKDELEDVRKGGAASAKSIGEVETRVKRLRDMRGKIDITNPADVARLRMVNSELKKLETQQRRLETMNGSRLKTWASDAFNQLPGAGLIRNPLVMAGTGAFMAGKLAMDANRTRTAMQVMAGDRQGGQLYEQLTKYANDTIFVNELHSNAQTMLGFGISSDKIMGYTKMLGDVSMGDANKLQSLTLAFSQIAAAGRLTGQDLLQLINAGFNPLGVISEKTGKSIGELKKEMEDGNITFAMVEDAFRTATSAGGRFYDMTNKMAQTPYGKLQAFLGGLQTFGVKLGALVLPVFTKLLGALSGLLDFVNKNGALTIAILTGLGAAFAVANVGAIKFSLALKVATLANSGLIVGLKTLTAFMMANPIFAVVAAGLAVLTYHAFKSQERIAQLREETAKLTAIRTDALTVQRDEKERLTQLLNTYNDANKPLKERQEALNKLRQSMGEYAKDLKTEKDWLEQGGIAIDRYTNKLYNQAIVRGAQDMIAENVKKRIEVEAKSDDEYAPGFFERGMLQFGAYGEGFRNVKDGRGLMDALSGVGYQARYEQFIAEKIKGGRLAELNPIDAEDIRLKNLISRFGGNYSPTDMAAADPYAGLGGDAAGGKGSKGSQGLADGIAGGGPRVININGVKFADNINIHSSGGRTAMQNTEDQLSEMFLRVLNSGAALQ